MITFKDRICGRSASRVCDPHDVCHGGGALILVVLLPLAILVWSYWPTIKLLFDEWQTNDDYSAGQLVPLIAVFLVWRQRKQLMDYPLVPCWWGGISLLLLVETASIYEFLAGSHPTIERYLMILAVVGLVLLVAGWRVLKVVSWILLFLLLMIPFPGRLHSLISGPLQSMATTGSVFLLEAFGARVSQEGNVVMLNETTPMAVAEACSGLRMLTAFVIVAAFVAYMVKRPRLHKTILLLSSIPVAVACNIARLCVTAILFILVSAEVGQKFFHDFAGLAMMPIAALLLFAELWLMDKLFVSEPGSEWERARGHLRVSR